MFLYQEKLKTNLCIEMARIPEGEFMMGSPPEEPERCTNEEPQHLVVVPSFYMARYPVTQAQWRFVAGLTKVKLNLLPDPAFFKGENLPVECVSWVEAVEFCERLSVYTGRKYALPSEAQWEYACRAGTTTPFHFGDKITTDTANYYGTHSYNEGSKGIYRKRTTLVGSFLPNDFGLYDMHSNVWEWCQDHWHDNYKEAPRDASPWMDLNPDKDEYHVLRGGSWYDGARFCRSASRNDEDLFNVNSHIGFRIVKELNE